MDYSIKELQEYIVAELLSAYEKRQESTLTFIHLLCKVINKYELYMYLAGAEKDVFLIQGKADKGGYNIIADTVFLVKKMLEYGIILFFEQAKTSSAFKPMGDEDPNYNIHGKISGTIAKFILDNLEQSIWISPDIVKFAENGFVTEELSIANKQMDEARKQTQKAERSVELAKWTLGVSVLTMMSSVCFDLYNLCLAKNEKWSVIIGVVCIISFILIVLLIYIRVLMRTRKHIRFRYTLVKLEDHLCK